MSDSLAIRLRDVSKIYKLYASQRDQLVDVLGLQRFGFRTRTPAKEFSALSNISLDVPRGHRVGIVGRNGAGKTTLLKLLCGNFSPTQGEIEVNGKVQALMSVGLGFHPEFTGRENVEASLQYNGLGTDEYLEAMVGIIDFCELGDFLDQPFKTYSLGMQARLMFAAATAIRPDILIVDEVLGAGDAYFVAKSKKRVERLVSSGCTMLLVSHSMPQVMELCDEAIWLHEGQIRKQDSAFAVVKAYEEYLHAPIKKIADVSSTLHLKDQATPFSDNQAAIREAPASDAITVPHKPDQLRFQEPAFLPHAVRPELPSPAESIGYKFIAQGGISRWAGTLSSELEFAGFTIVDESGETNTLISLRPVKFIIVVKAVRGGRYSCRYSINISDHLGQTMTSVKSPKDDFDLPDAGERRVEILFNPLQLGPGDYTVGMVILEYGPLELLNSAGRYDLLSRSFQFKVENRSSWASLNNQFFHSAEWSFE
jgi:lipopolysaccharide transport system ATP-binding protein